MDAGRLERARVAASRSSPAADTLDAAARIVDAPSLPALVQLTIYP